MKVEKEYIIYKVTNILNRKIYIGMTLKSLKARKGDHFSKVKMGSNSYFHNALRKYGTSGFLWEHIASTFSWEVLGKLETFFIEQFDSFNKGYNMTLGGEGTEGRIPSNVTLQKMSLAQKKRWEAKEKDQLRLLMKGNTYAKGYKHSPEARAKISLASKGVRNHFSRGLIFTDGKKFTTCKEAGQYWGYSATIVSRRCNSKHESWKNWYFEKSLSRGEIYGNS